MSAKFYPLQIQDIRKETNDCVSIALHIPEEWKKQFSYIQGQHINLKTNINREEIRRSYSVCSSVHDDELRIAVKKVDGGIFSTHANQQLKVGDVLEVMPPQGKFYTAVQSTNKKNYVFFAAGSGITPIISIIKTVLQTEPGSNCILVYGNRSKSSIIFKEQLEALKNKNLQRFQLIHILSREKTDAPVNLGKINAEKLKQLSRLINYANTDEFFICGPEEMTFTVKNYLEEVGIDAKKIHFELFGAKKPLTVNRKPVTDDTPKSHITIKLDGLSFDFDLPFDGESILDAAMKHGADVPFACKGGVCCTCKAKLIEGEVEMDVHYGLEHEEIEQGFILTCQSHPVSEKILIDFDH